MDPLVTRLTPIAERAAQLTIWHRRAEDRYLQDGRSRDAEHTQHALVAAFEAFLELGGHVDHVDDFLWEEKEAALVKATTLRLERTYRGPASLLGDMYRRASARASRIETDSRWWDGWGAECMSSTGARAKQATGPAQRQSASRYDGCGYAGVSLSDPMADANLTHVLDVMRDVVPPRAYHWVVARHLYNINIQTLVDEFVAEHPEYTGPDGRRRAQAVIDTAVSRARTAVRKALRERRTCP